MWINCDCGFECKTELRYIIDGNGLCVNCVTGYPGPGQKPELFSYFYNNDKLTEFEVGAFTYDNAVYSLERKYSRSYLESCGIDPDSLSHFSIRINEEEAVKAYPETDKSAYDRDEDLSIKRAKQTLDSLKKNIDFSATAKEKINYIEKHVRNYSVSSIPFFNDFDWYTINNNNEYFNLSSIWHLLNSEVYQRYQTSGSCWYFGINNTKRIYAVSAKCDIHLPNLFSNAQDCTVKHYDSKNESVYYTVGIILLDDGQYFCRLD